MQIDCSHCSRLLLQHQQKCTLWIMDIVVFPTAGIGFYRLRSYDVLVFINTWNLCGNYVLLTLCVDTLPTSFDTPIIRPTTVTLGHQNPKDVSFRQFP